MPNIAIRTVSAFDPGLHTLIDELDRELLTRYPAQGIFGLDFSDPDVSEITFAVAYLDGQLAGCGAIRPLDDAAVELKRFYVRANCRKQGIASGILLYLEGEAKRQSYTVLRLETGPRQPESIALYEKHGYRPIPLYGEYAGCEHSLCFEKRLG